MVNDKVFLVGFIELGLALILYLYVIKLQLNTFKNQTVLQPLKRLLLASVILLVVASIPLEIVYADAVWFRYQAGWLVPFAVIGNATAKLIVAFVLILIYKFRSKDDGDIF